MTTYIALLRGINVGGKHIIKMGDLKQVLEAIGFYEVQTYIQSGNVLFKSSEKKEGIVKKIEYEIESAFGFSVAVILRTSKELEQIIKNCPFSKQEILEAELSSESESVYVCLLTHVSLQEKTQQLNAYRTQSDDYRIVGREVYLLLYHSISKSKLANNLHKLGVQMTVRNWKTINKLYILSKEKVKKFKGI